MATPTMARGVITITVERNRGVPSQAALPGQIGHETGPDKF